jgi:hypothetical protein
MKSVDVKALPAPPNLIRALLAGFDSIANHVTLILFPVVLDLFLWLGPHLGMKTLLNEMLQQVGTTYGLSAQDVNGLQINLFSFLRSYPVGIPSLMAAWQPINNPRGAAPFLEVSSPGNLLLAWLGLTILGLSLGALYFALVARAAITGNVNLRQALRMWPQNSLEVLILAVLWLGLMIALSIPAACMLSLLAASGIGLNPVALILFAGFVLWVLFPLVFSPHGIFIGQGKAWPSVLDSVRMTRLTVSSTALFILAVIVISFGTDYFILRIPNEASWFTLVSLGVHAFVTTSLLAASFVYYRDANRWIQRLVQQASLSSLP